MEAAASEQGSPVLVLAHDVAARSDDPFRKHHRVRMNTSSFKLYSVVQRHIFLNFLRLPLLTCWLTDNRSARGCVRASWESGMMWESGQILVPSPI